MCGIAGFIDRRLPEPQAHRFLDEMLGRIVHRGPDGAGTHFAPQHGLALGMRRLSIIDLEGGAQPIWNEDRTIGVVFNGEIYNYLDLQRELRAAGHVLQTRSDTEVLVHLYEQYGEAMVEHLRGMFAFAILDSRAERLLIARDHFGQKPLYYTRSGERFAFASELKSLCALPWVSRERDPAAFLDYCAWLSLPPPRTHFRHIAKLAAGSVLSINLSHPADAEPRKYWCYSPRKKPADATVEELDSALRDSLQVHLRADVPLGVLLSSGLDSRTVSAYAQELTSGTMQTFTAGFGGEDSEAVEAAKTAREIGSRHHTIELTAADLGGSIERIAWHLDEPVGDPAAFAVLKICEYARQHVKVLLSGEGADELFAGYDARYLGMMQTLKRSDPLRPLRPLLPRPDPAAPRTRWNRLCERVHQTRGSEAVSLRMEGLPGDIRTPRGFTPEQLRLLQKRTREIAHEVYRPQRDLLSELLALDLDWQLAESLLQKADKMSMGGSIELRTPLLDVKIAELAARVPRDLKLPPGGPGKLILRQCLARKLHEPLTRPKKGFPVPLRDWFAAPLREQVEGALFSAHSTCLTQLDPRLLRTAWEDFLRGEWDGARLFYALWLYEVWARREGC
jgi:asparagine synthase (glutamine-hydrolysing)